MTSLFIALRYLFARKSHKVVNVISVISIAGVAVATMAIVVVLSVFNGFSRLAFTHLSAIDPTVKITPREAKVLESADSLAAVLEALPEVAVAMPVLEERALLAGDEGQTPVIVRGVDPRRMASAVDLDAVFIDGEYEPGSIHDSIAPAQLAVGVAVNTGLRPSAYSFADIYMPRRLGRINPANPAAAYRQLPVVVTGVFRIDQPEYDTEYVFAPLERVRELLEYEHAEASAIDVKAAPGVSDSRLAEAVSAVLPGDGFQVLDRERQQADTFRMISVEKWVTFLMLVFILVIASFNIVSTISLMVIEKADNMRTLRALGETRRSITSVFVLLGWLITVIGGVAGVLLGLILSLAQQHFGLIKLAADPSALTIAVYPVHVEWGDIALVLATIVVVGFAIAQVARIFTRKIFKEDI